MHNFFVKFAWQSLREFDNERTVYFSSISFDDVEQDMMTNDISF